MVTTNHKLLLTGGVIKVKCFLSEASWPGRHGGSAYNPSTREAKVGGLKRSGKPALAAAKGSGQPSLKELKT